MLPIHLSNNGIIKARDINRSLLEVDVVQKALTKRELLIAEASVKNSQIKDIDTRTLLDTITSTLTYLLRDIGYKGQPDEYDGTRFFDILRKYYSELTVSEVKLAFELAMVGELDNYLPTDKHGNPDKNHYQEFSVDYITKILNAYNERKRELWSKARAVLPPAQKEITPEQVTKIHDEFLDSIVKAFDEYKLTGELRTILIPQLYIREFIKSGILKDEAEPNEDEMRAALTAVISDQSINKYDRIRIIGEGGESVEVRTKAAYFSRMRQIKGVFDQLIQNNQTLQINETKNKD